MFRPARAGPARALGGRLAGPGCAPAVAGRPARRPALAAWRRPAPPRAAADAQPPPPPPPGAPPPGAPPPPPASAWSARRALQLAAELPLEVAHTLGNDDAHYLARRGRRRWWSRGQFPRVAGPSLAEARAAPPPLSLWQKVLPLGAIFFAASFNLTVLQSLKDALVVTAAGAEVLPFISTLAVLPASLAFFLLYGRLVAALPPRRVFYAALAPLVAFYAFFAAVLYPAHAALHPAGLSAAAAAWAPAGLLGLVKVFEFWTFTLFYAVAELWGAVAISVLFWSLANEVCSVAEAKSVYPLIGIIANVALVLAGWWLKFVSRELAPGSTQAMLNWLVGSVAAMSAAMALAKAGLDRWVIAPYGGGAGGGGGGGGAAPAAKREKKREGSFAESLAVVRGSAKVTNLAVLVVSYGVAHRLFEFAWKAALRALHPTPAAYQAALADVSIATGWATIAAMLAGKLVFERLGWGAAARATPAAMALAGGAFFALSLAAGAGASLGGLPPGGLAAAGVAAGCVTQVFARASKFSLFDPAKEMVYIEMSAEEKSRGKAAVDLLGSQIGKSGGAWVTQLLLLCTGSLAASLPAVAVAYAAVIASWLSAVGRLGRQLKAHDDAERCARGAGAGALASAAGSVDEEPGEGAAAAPAAARAA
jgi:AAA family ATP:ADP antiporter